MNYPVYPVHPCFYVVLALRLRLFLVPAVCLREDGRGIRGCGHFDLVVCYAGEISLFIHNDPKTKAIEFCRLQRQRPIGRSAPICSHAKCSAPYGPILAIYHGAWTLRISRRRVIVIIRVPVILAHFIDIAVHIKNPPRVGQFQADFMGRERRIIRIPCVIARNGVSVAICRRCSRAAGVFPLSFSRQTEGFACQRG